MMTAITVATGTAAGKQEGGGAAEGDASECEDKADARGRGANKSPIVA